MASSEARRICLRMTIIGLNVPILLIGVASLAVGLWVILDDASFFDLVTDVLDLDILGHDLLRQSSLIMVTAGAALVVLAGIGVVGSLALSSCLLVFYALVLTLLLTLEVAVVVLVLVFRSEWETKASKLVTDRMVKNYGDAIDDSRGPFTRTFNTLQRKLSCCGWTGPSNYEEVDRDHWNTTLDNGQMRTVPDECCHYRGNDTAMILECVSSPYNSSQIYHTGCVDKIKKELTSYVWTIFAFAVLLLFIQFVVIGLTMASVVHNGKVKYEMREVRA